MRRRECVFVMLMCLAFVLPAYADVLDPFDNAPAPAGTLGIGAYISYQSLPEYEDENAGDIDVGVKVPAFLLRPVWFGPKVAGKFSWGLNAIIPFVNVDADGVASQSGLGDIVVSPFIFLVENGPFNLSFWEFIYTPTGKYDENNPDTSPGLDTWQFQHQLALGWYPGRFGLDWTVNYWNRRESDKLNIDYQDAVETDLILHWTFANKLTAGVIGSFWWDVDDLEIDGQTIDDTQGHRYAAGFNLMYPIKEDIIVSGRYTHDVDVENHVKGDWGYLRVVFLF